MSNENSNLRVGSAGAGLFVGGTEITGGGGVEGLASLISIASDFSQVVYTNSGVFTVIIVNITDYEITLLIGSTTTIVPARHVEHYNVIKGDKCYIKIGAAVTVVSVSIDSETCDWRTYRVSQIQNDNYAIDYDFRVQTLVFMQ